MQQEFNQQTSLQLIESMINKARNNFSENGTMYLLWGAIVFVCGLVQFIAVHFYHNNDIYYVWFLTWLVVIYQIFYYSKKAKTKKVKTYTADILRYVWICFIIIMLLFVFTLRYQHSYSSIDTAILIMYGMPTFLSGIILKFRPLIVGAIACWLLAVGSVFVSDDFQSLFICAAVLIAWIIPGILLRIKFKNQN